MCDTKIVHGFLNHPVKETPERVKTTPTPTMSWQDYVDNQLLASQCVSKAAIAGHDGGVWAKSEGFEVSQTANLSFYKPAPPWPTWRQYCSKGVTRRIKKKNKKKFKGVTDVSWINTTLTHHRQLTSPSRAPAYGINHLSLNPPRTARGTDNTIYPG